MGICSVSAMIQRGNQSGQHLFDTITQMPIAKMHPIGKCDHIAEKVGAISKTLQDVWDFLTARIGPEPLLIGFRRITGGHLL